MAEPEANMSGITDENEDSGGFLPSFEDIDSFVQATFKSLVVATKVSNDLPSVGDDFDYYSSFESFRHLMDVEGTRVIQMIQKVMRHHGAKGNLSTNSEAVEIEDKFDILVDANDQILERAGTFLDEAAGLRKTETPLVLATMTPKGSLSGSWNNKKSPKAWTPKGSSYTLLAAKNIQRPQAKFRDKIDNSNRPFMPKIVDKPNAQKPLQDSLVFDANCSVNDDDYNNSFQYPHPYQYELDHITYPAQQLIKTEPTTPKPLTETGLTHVETVEELQKLLNALKLEQIVAVDLEHHSYRSFLGIVCLMQISTKRHDYIVDTLELRHELHILNEVFTNPEIVKIFHGGDSDIDWLQRDLGLYVVNMFDTGQACRMLNFPRFSLAHLLQHYCKVEANKQFQLADWRIRPLPEQLIKYAREDTHYLIYIYEIIKNELIERGNANNNLLTAVLQRSNLICLKRFTKPLFTEDGHIEMLRKSKKVFNSQQMSGLKALYAWRDSVARIEDESISFVLPNHMMLQMAEILPREVGGILACCNPIPPLVRQNMNELHSIIKQAKEIPLQKKVAPKSVAAFAPQKKDHPKYHQQLHCPHDMSQQQSHQDTHTVPDLDLKMVASKSSLFSGNQISAQVPMKDAPLVSAFAWPDKGTMDTAKATDKAASIQASFVNIMSMFLPGDIVKQMDGTHISEKWKLKPATAKKKPSKKVQKVIPMKTTETGDSAVISLDIEEKFKSKSTHPPAGQPSGSSEPVALRQQGESNPQKKKKRKREDRSGEEKADLSIPPAFKRKKDRLPDPAAAADFQPYDYTDAVKTMFKEKGGGQKSRKNKKRQSDKQKNKQKDYNPDEEFMDTKFKTGAKPRVNPKAGNKSMTYSKHGGGSSQQQWPKR